MRICLEDLQRLFHVLPVLLVGMHTLRKTSVEQSYASLLEKFDKDCSHVLSFCFWWKYSYRKGHVGVCVGTIYAKNHFSAHYTRGVETEHDKLHVRRRPRQNI